MSDIEFPLVGYHFFVEVQGKLMGAFREASGLTSESEKIEYKASGQNGDLIVASQPGHTKYPDIVLKRGLTSNMDMWNWRKEIEDGKFKEARKNGSIVLYDQTHAEVARWNFENAWPTKVDGPTLNATSGELAVESLTLAVDRTTRVT
jgi:phage tail-like protein